MSSFCIIFVPLIKCSAPVFVALYCFSYCVPAAQFDVDRLRRRVQESLPDWEVSDALQIVSSALGAKYASYRCVHAYDLLRASVSGS